MISMVIYCVLTTYTTINYVTVVKLYSGKQDRVTAMLWLSQPERQTALAYI